MFGSPLPVWILCLSSAGTLGKQRPLASAFTLHWGMCQHGKQSLEVILLFSVRARIGTANGPMLGPHPYTNGVSLTTPTPWRFVATTKTSNTNRQVVWPTSRALDSLNTTLSVQQALWLAERSLKTSRCRESRGCPMPKRNSLYQLRQSNHSP